MFTITCNWTLFSLHIFVEAKIDLLPLSLLVTFESHFDTPSPVPVTFDTYPENHQGEWN